MICSGFLVRTLCEVAGGMVGNWEWSREWGVGIGAGGVGRWVE